MVKFPLVPQFFVTVVEPLNIALPIEVTLLAIVIDVIEALLSAPDAISVTPEGTTTVPVHPVLPVTTLLVIVNVPLVPQFTGPSATAYALGINGNPTEVKTAKKAIFIIFCIGELCLKNSINMPF
jgi:hypothetical protein